MHTDTDTTNAQRNVKLTELAARLEEQQDRSKDYVAPASKLEATNGNIVVEGHTVARPSNTMLSTMAQRLEIPGGYLRRVHQAINHEDPDVGLHYMRAFDEMVNASLADTERSFMVRTFDAVGGEDAYGRALLSDRYRIVDNYDVLSSVLLGIEEAGVRVEIAGCDLSDTRMRARFSCPEVQIVAEEFLKNYRNPWGGDEAQWRSHSGYAQGEEPIIFAGFEVSNSEVGFGAFTIVPRFEIKICKNGLRITEDAMREVHLGSALTEGEVNWSDDTRQAITAVVGKQTRDAVAHFLNVEYLQKSVDKLAEESGTPIEEPEAVVQVVAKTQRWSDGERKGILDRFIKGGQVTAGGVMQAMTAHAQEVADPERAAELEELAVPAMRLAAGV